jgi:hypothetical protein
VDYEKYYLHLVVWSSLLVGFLFGLFFDPEDGDGMFLENVS